jgi:hypothetical protein
MALKQLPEDFKDFLNFLNTNGVKYLLIGGWAVGIYGYPRATGDMDVLIATDEANLDKLLKALYEFGAPSIAKDHFKEKGNVFRMGRSPIKIDVINEASGIDIEDCYSRRHFINIQGRFAKKQKSFGKNKRYCRCRKFGKFGQWHKEENTPETRTK